MMINLHKIVDLKNMWLLKNRIHTNSLNIVIMRLHSASRPLWKSPDSLELDSDP